jgi:site-specific DNA-methyltransferase (adenine-specific)
MNKGWDIDVPSVAIFAQYLRVLKQGGYMCCMSAPRQDVYIKMVSNIQQAGFDIAFDSIEWVYTSGFPKAQNIAKAIDARFLKQWVLSDPDRKTIYDQLEQPEQLPFLKSHRQQWAKEVYGKEIHDKKINPHLDGGIRTHTSPPQFGCNGEIERKNINDLDNGLLTIEEPVSPEAIAADGCYSYSLKPAREFIIVAQKPPIESTNLDQFMQWKNGGVWIDRCRVPITRSPIQAQGNDNLQGWNSEDYPKFTDIDLRGRFPANILVSDNVLDIGKTTKTTPHKGDGKALDTQKQGWGFKRMACDLSDESDFSDKFSLDNWWNVYLKSFPLHLQNTFPFLYIPKPTKAEKNQGLTKFLSKPVNDERKSKIDNGFQRGVSPRKNTHPTVKAIALMSYLIQLFTKPGDVVLDGFMGSGTTILAAMGANRIGIGIEMSPEYFAIAKARIEFIDKNRLHITNKK